MTGRIPRRLALGGALLLAGGAAALAAELVEGGPITRGLGRDAPVSRGAGDLGDISAHNSPALARNPRDRDNLVVTSRIDSPDFSCALHVSADGGARWSRTPVPIPREAGRKCYAPDAAFGPDGALHVTYATLEGAANEPSAVFVASSRDGGRTLSTPRRVTGPRAFQVRIAADPDRAGRLYVTWVQARDVGQLKFTEPGNPIEVSRSDDGGATWAPPARVSPAARGRVLAPAPAVGPRGELYVLYLDVGDDRLDYEGGHEGLAGPPYPGRFALVLARSRDGGRSFEESVADDRVVPAARFIAFLPPFPSLALDRESGRIHAGFHDARLGSPDVWVWTLEPGAPRWSRPVRVNDTPRGDGSTQYLPQLAVAPGGRLDAVYYDRRGDPRDIRNEVALQSSLDGGRSFAPHVTLSTQPFDSRIGFGLAGLGSRLGLVSDAGGATAVWSDTRAGSDASGKQDLVRASVAIGASAARRRTAGALRYGGLGLALVGVASLALAAARRPSWSGFR